MKPQKFQLTPRIQTLFISHFSIGCLIELKFCEASRNFQHLFDIGTNTKFLVVSSRNEVFKTALDQNSYLEFRPEKQLALPNLKILSYC